MTTYLPLTPLLLIVGIFVLAALELRDRIRVGRNPSPDWGCCGCGADMADVLTHARGEFGDESYCWGCLDTWPGNAPYPPEPYTVFPGRAR